MTAFNLFRELHHGKAFSGKSRRLFFSFLYLVLPGILAGVVACKNSRDQPNLAKQTEIGQVQEKSMKIEKKQQPSLPPTDYSAKQKAVAPDNCRVLGQVLQIFPDLAQDKTDPCGQVPCRALVRIERVMAYGQGFLKPLREGQEIKVYFSLTLAPTAKYFPGLAQPLPGLAVGSRFQADFREPGEGSSPGDNWYEVKTYLARPK